MKEFNRLFEKYGCTKIAEICKVDVRSAQRWKVEGMFPDAAYSGRKAYIDLIVKYDKTIDKEKLLRNK